MALNKEEIEKALVFSDSHRKYLQTHYWRKKKKEYFSRNLRRCMVCTKVRGIHLHHRNYDNPWEEKDSDLVPLCATHHVELHNLQGNYNLDVEAATVVYLACRANYFVGWNDDDEDLIKLCELYLEERDNNAT